jgi:hypothetical protein
MTYGGLSGPLRIGRKDVTIGGEYLSVQPSSIRPEEHSTVQFRMPIFGH